MRHDRRPDWWPESDASITVASQSKISDDAVYACKSRLNGRNTRASGTFLHAGGGGTSVEIDGNKEDRPVHS